MDLPSHHPFGQEASVSLKQLFVAFCNNLKLGQWELARACLISLHAQNETDSGVPQAVDLLQALAKNPHNTW